MVFVFAFKTLVSDKNRVMNARINPIIKIIHEKVSLERSSIDMDICVIAENAEGGERDQKNKNLFLPQGIMLHILQKRPIFCILMPDFACALLLFAQKG